MILGLLQIPLRCLNDLKKTLDNKESTVDGDEVNPLLGRDFQKLCDLSLRLVKEYYNLSGKEATKKRLTPITEIISENKK